MDRVITLDDRHETLLRRLLESGRFADAASAVGAALEMLRAEHDEQAGWTTEALRDAVRKGIESGPGIPIEEAFGRVEKALEARIGARRED